MPTNSAPPGAFPPVRGGRARCAALLACLVVVVNLLPPAAAAPRADSRQRQQVFDLVWSRVKERHYDTKLGGVDWDAVRKRYAPRIARAKDDAAVYGLLNQMLGELKQSHFGLIPPQVYLAEEAAKGRSQAGEVGLTVQLVEDRAVVTEVRADSPAAQSGLRPGFVIDQIDGRPVETLITRVQARKLRPAVERLQVMLAVQGGLNGPVDSGVRVGYRDADDRARTALLTRREPPGERTRFGELPLMPTRIETRRVAGDIGYIRFNIFLMPLLEPVRRAVREMRDAPAIILDLRGNVGGIGYLAVSVAQAFSDKQTTLGTMRLRQGEIRFPVFPGAEAYRGPLVILTDEASLSTSEILAGSLQENGRALLIGRTTGGMVLPSTVERLPGGARLQYAIADFKTPRGILLEGRGVRPDIPVAVTRRALLAGRDPILDAAIAAIQKRTPPEGEAK